MKTKYLLLIAGAILLFWLYKKSQTTAAVAAQNSLIDVNGGPVVINGVVPTVTSTYVAPVGNAYANQMPIQDVAVVQGMPQSSNGFSH